MDTHLDVNESMSVLHPTVQCSLLRCESSSSAMAVGKGNSVLKDLSSSVKHVSPHLCVPSGTSLLVP